MSFPNYSSLFTLGLSSSASGPSKPAPIRAMKKPSGGCRRPRAHSLKSFLKLDTRDEPTIPPMSILPTMTAHTSASDPTHSLSICSPPPTLMFRRRSHETLRSIPSPRPIPSSQTLPEPPSLDLPLPFLPSSTSPAATISTPLPRMPLPPTATQSMSESTIDSPCLVIPVRPPFHARKSSTTLGVGLGHGLIKAKPTAYVNRMSVTASSVASSRRRHVQRSAALANLEGRSLTVSSTDHIRAAPSIRNFISMSDDEDDRYSQPQPLPQSVPVSSNVSSHVGNKIHRSRALSDVSSVVLRANFLDFTFSSASTMISSPSIHSGDMADDGLRALDAALFAALGSGGLKSQTFSSFIDVSA